MEEEIGRWEVKNGAKREGRLNLVTALLQAAEPPAAQLADRSHQLAEWATLVSNPRLQHEPPPVRLHFGKPNKAPAALGTGARCLALPGWR